MKAKLSKEEGRATIMAFLLAVDTERQKAIRELDDLPEPNSYETSKFEAFNVLKRKQNELPEV